MDFSNAHKVLSRVKSISDTATVVCATKMVEPSVMNQIKSELGLDIVGENKVQELLSKYESANLCKHWHIIGQLQTNKVKYIADKVEMIQSLDRTSLALEIEKQCAKLDKTMNVLIEVNMGGEISKGGVEPEKVIEFIESLNENDSYTGEQAKDEVEEKYILRNNLSVSVDIEGNEQNVYCFAISYKDKDVEQAKIKAKICVEAYSREIQAPSSAGQEKYFSGIKIYINSLGLVGEPTPDLTKTKLALLGGVIGVLLATMLVYLISVIDGSVKSKAELEELTGIKHLSNIDYSVVKSDYKIESERSENILDEKNIGGN